MVSVREVARERARSVRAVGERGIRRAEVRHSRQRVAAR